MDYQQPNQQQINQQQPNQNIQPNPVVVQPPKNIRKIVILIIIGVLILGSASYGAYYWWLKNNKPVACTQEAKQCPDGSYVSRTGPNCEFAPCPSKPLPDINLELSAIDETVINKEFKIRLTLTPAQGLGNEFFSTPANIKIELPAQIQLIEGSLDQNLNFTDFSPKSVKIKVKSSVAGNYEIKSVVTKQNSGEFSKNLTINIASDPTANWQTYRNEKYGFEVKYPKDWKLQEYPYKYSNDINIVIDPEKVYSEAELYSSELPPRLINISINFEEGSKNYTGVDVKIGDNILAKKTDEMTSADSPSPFMSNKHRISYQIDNFECCGYSRDVSRMSIHYFSDKTDKYLEKFNQILSTFKFTK